MQSRSRRGASQKAGVAAACVALLLVGCSHRRAVPVAETSVAPPPPRPTLSPELGAVKLPPRDADGYRTINSGIDPLQTVWHVRAALNVAAIGCRGPDDAHVATSYNAMLTNQKALLKQANGAVEAGYRQRYGKSWQDEHDAYMTRLYNFFAQPFAKGRFCAVADSLAPQAAAIPAASFQTFAQAALPQLEAPFTDGYARIDRYRTDLAAWDARYGPGAPAQPVALAQAATAPAEPVRPKPSTRGAPMLAYEDLKAVMNWTSPGTRYATR